MSYYRYVCISLLLEAVRSFFMYVVLNLCISFVRYACPSSGLSFSRQFVQSVVMSICLYLCMCSLFASFVISGLLCCCVVLYACMSLLI